MKFNYFVKGLVTFLVIGLYLVVTPFIQLPETGMYDSKRVLQLLLFLVFAVIFLIKVFRANTSNKTFALSKKVLFTIFLIMALGFLSTLLSVFPQDAFLEIFLFGVLLSLSLLISVNTRHGNLVLGKFIYIAALLFTGIYLIYFFGNYIAAHLNPLVPMWPDRLAVAIRIGDTLHRGEEVLNFTHKRFFNHIQTWTLPLIISAVLYFKNNKLYRNLLLVLLVCWWCLVFASGARGTITAFVLACLVLIFLFRKRSYSYLSFAGIGVVGGLVSYWLLFKVIVPSESLPVARMSDSGRLGMWDKALEMWLSNPILGAGPMHYAVIKGEPYFAHPHNFYLQFLAEWGILALMGFLVLLISYFLFFKKRFMSEGLKVREMSYKNTAVYMGMTGSLLGGFLHAGVSGVFHTPMSQIWMVLIIAWFLSLWNRYHDSHSVIKISKKYFAIFYMVLVAGLLYSASPYLSKLDKEHVQYRSDFEDAKLYPRFWEQGLIYEREEGRTVQGEEKTGSDGPEF